ncbi:TBPIP-domain-containing protein [Clavulina sp. PMI_390]|nr:TBPIP-domain-containing protein [Clavulina sp. PMI_390]
MPPKDADKVPMLKGPAAEKAVKDYVNFCNRPYGAADIAANMKTVSKPNAQKILVALAEKGEITQKTAGKQTYFVANQSDISDVPPEQIKELEGTLIAHTERIKALTASNKTLASEATAIRMLPSETELPGLMATLEDQIRVTEKLLVPHRSNNKAPPTEEEVAAADAEWTRWREEWKKRKTMFKGLWSQVTDSMDKGAIENLAEELGLEFDTPEHDELERGPLCQPKRGAVNKKLTGSGIVKGVSTS